MSEVSPALAWALDLDEKTGWNMAQCVFSLVVSRENFPSIQKRVPLSTQLKPPNIAIFSPRMAAQSSRKWQMIRACLDDFWYRQNNGRTIIFVGSDFPDFAAVAAPLASDSAGAAPMRLRRPSSCPAGRYLGSWIMTQRSYENCDIFLCGQQCWCRLRLRKMILF